jgi:hypothetical protein
MQAEQTGQAERPLADGDVRPPLTALMRQLGLDAQAFVKAEAVFIKERAGEGWSHAMPGVVAIGIAVALLFGAFIAFPLGVMLILADYVGIALSVPIVMVVTTLIGYVLFKYGQRRLKAALKLPEDR